MEKHFVVRVLNVHEELGRARAEFRNSVARPGNAALVEVYRERGLRMSCDVEECLADFAMGHDHRHEHGHFYDAHGKRITLGMGTNCDIYYEASCQVCPRTLFRVQCVCGVETNLRATSVLFGDQDEFKEAVIQLALGPLQLVYLMRRDATDNKQYADDPL